LRTEFGVSCFGIPITWIDFTHRFWNRFLYRTALVGVCVCMYGRMYKSDARVTWRSEKVIRMSKITIRANKIEIARATRTRTRIFLLHYYFPFARIYYCLARSYYCLARIYYCFAYSYYCLARIYYCLPRSRFLSPLIFSSSVTIVKCDGESKPMSKERARWLIIKEFRNLLQSVSSLPLSICNSRKCKHLIK